MEHLILSLLLAISLYKIDYIVSYNGLIGLILYIMAGSIYLIYINKINKSLNMKKNIFTAINNIFLHISFVLGLLVIIYSINGVFLGEGMILGFDFIQYPLFIIFIFPIFLLLKILITKNFFKNSKNANLLTLSYLISPLYFWNFNKNLPLDTTSEEFTSMNKGKWILSSILVTIIIVYIGFFIQGLFMFFQNSATPENYEIQSNGSNIEYMNHSR